MTFLDTHITQIKKLCKANKITTLFAFGSVTRSDFRENSDVDFIIDIQDNDPISYAEKYFKIKSDLENLLKRKIDLLEQNAIRNKILIAEIERSKTKIYG